MIDYTNDEDKVDYNGVVYNKDYYITVVYPQNKLRARLANKNIMESGWMTNILGEDETWDNWLLGYKNDGRIVRKLV